MTRKTRKDKGVMVVDKQARVYYPTSIQLSRWIAVIRN